MARVIELYVPRNFATHSDGSLGRQVGKVIDFRSQAKKSGLVILIARF